MLLELQKEIIYGPVRSRRLGASLGVNVLPVKRKVCSFDCLYCQYGRSQCQTAEQVGAGQFPEVEEVLAALERGLLELEEKPVYITFSGNGEATLHPDFGELVEGVLQVRDRVAPGVKTAILSNSATVSDPAIREHLRKLDVRIMKLDAGVGEVFDSFNRPAKGVSLEGVVEGLKALGGVMLQSLFAKGEGGNYSEAHIAEWVKVVTQIEPEFVQVYSLARQSPTETLIPLENSELESIKKRLDNEKIKSYYY
ncbi:MAG: radical SAM protein [bacterium]|nr:radical SAM protein [bacterium]